MPKTTPLVTWHRNNGGKMVDFAGWEMPVQYAAGIIQEHLAVRKSGGLFDVSHMGRLRFKGEKRLEFLQHVMSGNCMALEPWQAQYTLIPTPGGGAVDDAFLYRFDEDDYLMVVNASNKDKDLAHFAQYLPDFPGVEIDDVSDELAMIAFQGPCTHELLQGLMEAGQMPEPRQNCLGKITICGTEMLISRTGYTGEPNSFELFVPADKAGQIWQCILDAGGDSGVMAVGLGARDTLRLEAGMPLYGHELGEDPDGAEIPCFAIGLAPVAVSFSGLKGDYVGKGALAAQLAAHEAIRDGVEEPPEALPRRIMPLALEDKGVPRAGYEVFKGDRKVGVITSGTSVPYWLFEGSGSTMTIKGESAVRPLALAYLDSDIWYESELTVKVRKRSLRARVVEQHGRSEAPPYFHALPVGWERPKHQGLLGEGLAKMRDIGGKALANHRWRQEACINLIPSEQTMSPLVKLLSISDPVQRYAEHRQVRAMLDQEVFYYQGTDFIAWVEERLAVELADFLGCDQVETRPLSGQMANMTLFSALCAWKNRAYFKTEPQRIDLAITNHIGNGGHLSAQPMGALRDYIRKDPITERFAVVNFPVLAENPYRVDLAEMAKILDQYQPELIVFGKSMVLHKEPVAEVRALLEERGQKAFILYDMAHVLGLVGPHFQEPFKEGADFVTGSTHKTYFGTQRGVVGCAVQENTPQWELWQAIQRRAFPGMTSNHHLGSMLGLLAAAVEMNTFKEAYQPRVLANAKYFAQALKDAGLNVQGDPELGYTETHQVILEVGYAKGPEVARRLEENNIICNYQALPSDEGFSASSGLRLGVQEMTRFGMDQAGLSELAGLMADCINKGQSVADSAAALRRRFCELQFCFADSDLEGLAAELRAAV